MTDGTQQQDPAQQQTSGDDVFSGIFGGSETVFDNPTIFKPIEDETKKNESPFADFHIDEEPVEEVKEETPIDITHITEEKEEAYTPVEEATFSLDEAPIEETPLEDTFTFNETADTDETPVEEEELSVPEVEDKPIEKVEEEEETIEKVEEETIETPAYPEGASDLIISFYDLLTAVKRFESLSEFAEHKELLGGNTDSIKLVYELQSEEETITAYRKELQKETKEETLHTMTLALNDAKDSLQVFLDDALLYDEKEDLIESPNKKMQVSEKIHKFLFLLQEATKELEKKRKETQENKEQKKILQSVFRNF